MLIFPDGGFYDEDYYERGRESGKGWLQNYRWMPLRSYREALAFIEYGAIAEAQRILDVGCAKGFLVRAFNQLGYDAEGCDISYYALFHAQQMGVDVWNCDSDGAWHDHSMRYDIAVCKDVLEHIPHDALPLMLKNIAMVSRRFMCVVPVGENGRYIIPEYHSEVTHVIVETPEWWGAAFEASGWKVIDHCPHVPGLKDNWYAVQPTGNHVFLLEFQEYRHE